MTDIKKIEARLEKHKEQARANYKPKINSANFRAAVKKAVKARPDLIEALKNV